MTKRSSSEPDFWKDSRGREAPLIPTHIPKSSALADTTSFGIAMRADALFRIELALSRMENGDYGYCVTCEQPLPIKELEADPSLIICGKCKKPHK